MAELAQRRRQSTWPGLVLAIAAVVWGAIGSLGCGPPPPPEGSSRPAEDTWPNGTVRMKGTEVARSGEWVKEGPFVFYDEDGEATHSGRYELGLETGVWHENYGDGGSGSGPFVEGRRHGTWRYLHSNGKVSQEGEYVDGERVGVWQRWSPAGEPRTPLDYDAE